MRGVWAGVEGVIELSAVDLSLNIAQDIFLVLFSILYGVMLGSLSRLQPFPLERARKGFINRHNVNVTNETADSECMLLCLDDLEKKIMSLEKKLSCWSAFYLFAEERLPRALNFFVFNVFSRFYYNKYCNMIGRVRKIFVVINEVYPEWLICMWRKRIACSIILLNVLPALYVLVVLGALGGETTIQYFTHYFPFIYVVIFWAALGVFGFYRLYHSLICSSWQSLFCDVAAKIQKEGTSFDGWANLDWALIYLVPPIALLVCFVYQFPWGVACVCLFVVAVIMHYYGVIRRWSH